MNYDSIRKKSFKNAFEVLQSQNCGCFYCLKIYPTSEINENCIIAENDGKETVWCSKCGIDAVIPESTEYKLDVSLLKKLHVDSFEIDDDFYD